MLNARFLNATLELNLMPASSQNSLLGEPGFGLQPSTLVVPFIKRRQNAEIKRNQLIYFFGDLLVSEIINILNIAIYLVDTYISSFPVARLVVLVPE